MNKISGVLVGLNLLIGAFNPTGVVAATTATAVTGSMGITGQGCLQLLTVSVSQGENCMYNSAVTGAAPGTVPFGEVTGPYSQATYYDSVLTPQAFQTTPNGSGRSLYVPATGDGKISQVINGSVTIDDNGDGFGANDLISFSLTLTSPGGGDVIRHLGSSVIDRYTSMTQVLAPRTANSAAPNASGGFDYVIGSAGFPTLLTFNVAPCAGQSFGSMDCSFSFTASLDPDGWSGVTVAGLSSLEGNTGARTAGSLVNPQCIDSITSAGVASNDCQDSKVSFGPLAIGPNLTPGGVTAEDVGWDQLLLKVSTNAAGRVVAVAGFDVQEYQTFGGNFPCGSDPGAVFACNSWLSGYFVLSGPTANDDGPFITPEGSATDLDILGNDVGFNDPVTVTITTAPTQGTLVVNGSPGNAAGVVVTYTANIGSSGSDSFVYTVDDGANSDSATVITSVAFVPLSPVARDGTISSISTAGTSPLGTPASPGPPPVAAAPLRGTFTAPGAGGSLGNQPSSVTITTQGLRGTATVSGSVITYTVTDASFYSGQDQFSYLIADDDGETDSGVVTVTIADVAPTIADALIVADQNRTSTPLVPVITAGNGSREQHVLGVSAQAANGTCALTTADANATLSYTPNADFVGEDSCALTIVDAEGDSDVAAVNITVNAVNEIPGTVGGASSMGQFSLLLLAAAAWLRRRRDVPGAVRARAMASAVAAGCAAMAINLVPGAAAAQEANRVGGLTEIVVTARKVEEKLLDVPLAVTAFDSDAIETAGISNLSDVAELTPGLSFFNAFGENLPVPVIRGIAPTDIFGQNNAAVFVDGVYISGREGLNFGQLDIDRIEVVKGPQSALYGRTAFSGAINYVTKAPSDELEGRMVAETGNRGKIRALGMISGPLLGETLTGRLSAQYDEWDGSYDNALSSNDIGGYRLRNIQSKVRWVPNDDWDINLSYYKATDDIDEAAVVSLPLNCEDRLNDGNTTVRLQNFCGEVPDIESVPGMNGSDAIPKVAQATGENRELDRVNLKADWDLQDYGSVSSLTGYSRTRQDSVSDFGRSVGESQPFLYCAGATVEAPGVPNSCLSNPANLLFFSGVYNPELGDETEEWSQELRFTSPQDRSLRYTAGGYWYRTEETAYPGNPVATQPLPAGGVGLPPFDPSAPNFAIGTAIFYTTFTPDGGIDPLGRPVLDEDTEGWAFFGGLDYDLTERLTLRTELRFSHESQDVRENIYAECPDTTTSVADCGDDMFDLREKAPAEVNQGSERFQSTTGRVGLDFRLTDDWMVYGSVAYGEKPGGLQLQTATVLPPGAAPEERLIVSSFDPEELTAYEIGLKGTAFDGRMTVSSAVFYNDWKEIVLRQLRETEPSSGFPLDQPTAFNVNAGDAGVWGFEGEVNLQITDYLKGRVTAGWVDAEIDNAKQDTYENFPAFAPDGDVSGNKLLRQPEWMLSGSLSYGRELFGDWDWYASGDASYQSGIYVGNDNQGYLPEHTYVNTKLGIKSGRYTVEVWGRNIFDDDGAIAAFRDIYWANTDNIYPPYVDQGARPNFDEFVPLRYSVTYPRERTYGITAQMRFGAAVK